MFPYLVVFPCSFGATDDGGERVRKVLEEDVLQLHLEEKKKLGCIYTKTTLDVMSFFGFMH